MRIQDAMSLKDKRRIVRSIKDRLHREHQVSVAEIGANDVWNMALMGLAVVSADGGRARSVLAEIVAKLRAWPDAELADYELDVVDATALDSDEYPRASGEEGTGGDGGVGGGGELWTPDERRDE